jgi:putative DNA primase/helicase
MSDLTPDTQDFTADRPRVEVGEHVALYEQVDAAWAALVKANDPQTPRVLVRGNSLTRMTERGELEEFTVDSLRDELSRAADFGRFSSAGEWLSKTPPFEVAKTLLARDSAEYVNAPVVDRVVDVPVLAPNGTLTTTPGHHAENRLYYRPTEALAGTSFEAPPAELVSEVEEARDYLMAELLGDFEFTDQGSRAHAFGLMLLPFVRDYIEGPTPLHVIIAPEPGTGKTLLAQTALYPGCGFVATTAGDRNHNDEWRKSLTASLMTGTRAIVFDNLSGQLDSGPLASAITTGVWTDRVLGYSKQVTLPVRNAWVATGNNLDLSDEQARRAVPIFLDPGETRPADRPDSAYRHPDLLGWVGQHRPETVEAALVLVRHWAHGRAELVNGGFEFYRDPDAAPPFGSRTLGSFGSWAKVIGGVLDAADVPGFLAPENRERLFSEANEESREVGAFLAAWAALERGPMTFAEVVYECTLGGLKFALPTDLAGLREERLHKKLTYWLRQQRKRRVGGFQLLYDDAARLWSVRPV